MNTKVYCSHCGFSKIVNCSSGGADDISSLYGHHQCPDGDMGLFRDVKPIPTSEGKEDK